MNILRALAREEKKSLKLIEEAQRKLDTVFAARRIFVGHLHFLPAQAGLREEEAAPRRVDL